MKRVRTKDTAPEMTFRKLLVSAGLLYRGHYNAKAVPLGASISISRSQEASSPSSWMDAFGTLARIAVRSPKANGSWWAEKLQSNRVRD
jgi:G:T-mismatch repair DNA endonuclease (very short patch repair protein)